jgi:RNA polymerase sigma-70 factor (ECF subfamily)
VQVEGFEAFHRLMYPKILRYARRRLDAGAADDVASQTMQALWDKDLDDPADEIEERKLRSLAYRVAEGLIRNAVRAGVRRSRLIGRLASAAPGHEPDVADVVVNGTPSWVSELPLTDREVLALLVDGYPVAEIAVILDCSPAAVTMRLQRAKKNLRALMGKGVAHD